MNRLKKRSDAGEYTNKKASASANYSVFAYIAALFAVTLLLLLLSWFVGQRNSSDEISNNEPEKITSQFYYNNRESF